MGHSLLSAFRVPQYRQAESCEDSLTEDPSDSAQDHSDIDRVPSLSTFQQSAVFELPDKRQKASLDLAAARGSSAMPAVPGGAGQGATDLRPAEVRSTSLCTVEFLLCVNSC